MSGSSLPLKREYGIFKTTKNVFNPERAAGAADTIIIENA